MAHETTTTDSQPHGHLHHVLPIGVYGVVYAALLLLLVITVAVARVHLGPLNNAVALAIAIVKALLVMLYFMGLRYSSRLTWLWACAGFLFLIIMLSTLGDYATRYWEATSRFPQP